MYPDTEMTFLPERSRASISSSCSFSTCCPSANIVDAKITQSASRARIAARSVVALMPVVPTPAISGIQSVLGVAVHEQPDEFEVGMCDDVAQRLGSDRSARPLDYLH